MTAPIVLAALDGSEHALVSLPVAKTLAELEDATLHIVHVAERALPPTEILERIGLDPGALHGSVLDPRSGEPASAIVHAAAESATRAIVMCTHTGVAKPGKALGDTALGVLRRAPCPVVFVHPERGALPWSLRRILLPRWDACDQLGDPARCGDRTPGRP